MTSFGFIWDRHRCLTPLRHELPGTMKQDLGDMSDRNTIMRTWLPKLHRKLIEIASLTGHEHAVGEFWVGYLKSPGFRTSLQAAPSHRSTDAEQGRCNVLAWHNTKGGPTHSLLPTVLVPTYIDTVPPHIQYSLWSPKLAASTLIKGRGGADAKGSAAAQIITVEELLVAGQLKPQDVMLLLVVDEEEGGVGMGRISYVLKNPSGNCSNASSLLPRQLLRGSRFRRADRE